MHLLELKLHIRQPQNSGRVAKVVHMIYILFRIALFKKCKVLENMDKYMNYSQYRRAVTACLRVKRMDLLSLTFILIRPWNEK